MRLHAPVFALGAILAAGAAAPVTANEESAALLLAKREAIKEAKARHPDDRQAQARTLIDLAWPADGPGDPVVQALARQELIYFGQYAMAQLRWAIERVDAVHTADVVATVIDAQRTHARRAPPDFQPALEDALWHGSVEARRLAILQLERRPFPPALLPIVDSIQAHPELGRIGLRALGRSRDPRARFFLGDVLQRGHPEFQRAAGRALAMIGQAGEIVLREALAHAEASVREAAWTGFLELATVDDVTLLHEYVGQFGERDDPAVVERVRERAIQLEVELEQRQLAEAASGEPEEEQD